jgi:hypothetical protein
MRVAQNFHMESMCNAHERDIEDANGCYEGRACRVVRVAVRVE